MNKDRRDRLVKKAFQYPILEIVYDWTRRFDEPIKWFVRIIMTFLIAMIYSPVYYVRMKKLQSNRNILSISPQKGRPVKLYLPNIYIAKCEVLGDYIQMMIFTRKKVYEADILEYVRDNYIHPGMTFVDVGANIGNHSVYFAKICEAQQVMCFEPIESTYSVLINNLYLNSCHNVKAYNIALGKQASRCSVKTLDSANIGGASLETDDDSGDIIVKNLDSFNFSSVDLIKIDVEGMEYDVLKGAESSIEQHKPLILIEIWPENYKRTNDLLMEYGYYLVHAFSGDNYLYRCKYC